MTAMSFNDFADVVNYAKENNSPFHRTDRSKPVVKYIDPSLDMRNFVVFSIRFRGFSGEVNFFSTNEFADHPMTLKERVMRYLETGEIVPAKTTPRRLILDAPGPYSEVSCMTCHWKDTAFKADPCTGCVGDSKWKKIDYSQPKKICSQTLIG